jgi:hypothetical protein
MRAFSCDNRLMSGWWLVAGAAVAIAVANLRTMGPLWACEGLERSQKIAQTVLVWLLPGSFMVVRQIVRSSRGLPSPEDATRSAFAAMMTGHTDAMSYERERFDDGGGSFGHDSSHHGHDGGGHDGGGTDGDGH